VKALGAPLLRWLRRRSYPAVLRLGALLGFLWCWLLPLRRGQILANLAAAFPESPPAWRARVRRGCLRHFATMGLELLWLPRMDKEWMRAHVRFTNPDLPGRLLARGRGLIGVGGHFGNWEVMGAACAGRGLPVSYIVKRIHDPWLDEEVNAARRAHGVEILFTREAGRGVLKHFRRGRLVAFLSDQDARSRGVFVPYFGREASTPRGAAVYALRLGVPVMFVSCLRQGDGRYEVEFVEVPVEPDWTLCDEHVAALTARYTALLEERVRRHPEQWFWMHRRWKTRPGEIREGAESTDGED
jgi:Kdo2-lipid IVA lauroyltransferase/acyltransferase